MRKKSKLWLIPIFIVVTIVTLILFLMILPKEFPNVEWATIQSHMVLFMPWMISLSVAFVVLGELLMRRKGSALAFIVLVCAVIGIILAMIVYNLNAEGILLDEYITGTITITDVMSAIIILWCIIGVSLATLKS